MVRVFVALELTAEIRERLREAQAVLRGCPGRLTFVEPDLIHITLKFLGEVEEQNLPRLKETLRNIAFRPFPVTIGAVTVNNPKRPHTVWCTIQDEGEGKKLFRQVEEALAPLGFERETREFTPHATLARVKVPHPSLVPVVKGMESKSFGNCMIPGIKLKKSTLTPRGPIYEDLLEVTW